MTVYLPDSLSAAVKTSLDEWRTTNKVQKLWARDPSLWTDTDEGQWLGWLDIVGEQHAQAGRIHRLGEELGKSGFSHVLLLGMGGSSLCPEVMARTFPKSSGLPCLHVLDSTDPGQISSVERAIDLTRTAVIVSSKSGSTLEPNVLKQYFFERIKQATEPHDVGRRFMAITDPDSVLHRIAEKEQFRNIFLGVPNVGGRYSALSYFGMVPAASMGVDIVKMLDQANEMVERCARNVPPADNPGVLLGTILGVLANHGKDKLTIVTSPALEAFGAWVEQLLAESTGKEGKGIIPIDLETLGTPDLYGDDRLFAYVRLDSAPDPQQDAAIDRLEAAGRPVVRISLSDIHQLGAEMFRWELATAVAGSIMGINAFNQPDVEASKVATRALTSEYERSGSLPSETPLFEDSGIRVFADDRNAARLLGRTGDTKTLAAVLKAHVNALKGGDYFGLLAYVEMNERHRALLQEIRHAVRDRKRVATCVGFGPRFLHSTGQIYKGGPNSGVFLQITCDDARDLPVPGQSYTFGIVKAAQARGDFQVLAERGRRAMRVHLGANVPEGLEVLKHALDEALKK